MKCKALNNLLNLLRKNVSGKEPQLEIDEIENILSTRKDLSVRAEALCRTLSLTFTLRVTDQLMALVHLACKEALSWGRDREQVLDSVDDFLDHRKLDQGTLCLIQSWLLFQADDLQSALEWAQAARRAVVNSDQPTQKSWSRRTEAGIHSVIGLRLQQAGLFRGAEAAYTQACILGRRFAGYWVNLGSIRIEREKFSDALLAFNRALKIDHKEPGAWVGIARVYLQQRNFEEAESVLQKGMMVSRDVGQLYYMLGWVQAKMGESFSAISSYCRALSLGYEDALILNDLGLELKIIGRYDDAIMKFRQSRSLYPGGVRQSLNLICLFLEIKKFPSAVEELRRFLESQLQRTISCWSIVTLRYSSCLLSHS